MVQKIHGKELRLTEKFFCQLTLDSRQEIGYFFRCMNIVQFFVVKLKLVFLQNIAPVVVQLVLFFVPSIVLIVVLQVLSFVLNIERVFVQLVLFYAQGIVLIFVQP